MGWFASPPVDELLNDLKQLIESTEYDNNDFDSYNPYAFNKIFRMETEADPYVILGEYSLINKNYEDGFNFFKKAFEITDQINLPENFNNVDFEWIKYNFETSLATLYFLSKKKIRDEKVVSADYLGKNLAEYFRTIISSFS